MFSTVLIVFALSGAADDKDDDKVAGKEEEEECDIERSISRDCLAL